MYLTADSKRLKPEKGAGGPRVEFRGLEAFMLKGRAVTFMISASVVFGCA